MIEIALQYGLFLAKAVTIVVAIGVIIAIIAGFARRERHIDHLEVKHLNRRFEAMERTLKSQILPKKAFKSEEKARKRKRKQRGKSEGAGQTPGKRVFVLNFQGDIRATAVAALREEVTAILTLAEPSDEVVVRLTNSGGLVHEHGLAASQLARIREKRVPLTVAVDKIAASGGYMMACVANRVIAAPFAVLGSIGVLLQLPNFHRLLDAHGVDFEQIKGGEFKRTLTVFGRNTEAERSKMREEIEETHTLFKQFVEENRPDIDISQVATGEHWYGKQALALNLCDELTTSDDYLLEASKGAELYEVIYTTKKPLTRKLASAIRTGIDEVLGSWRQREHDGRYAA